MPAPSWRLGRRAERRAARHLRRNKYLIVEKNVRIGRDELDLIAVRDGVVVFVEVRFRSHGAEAAELSVDQGKARRVRRAVAAYRSREGLWNVPCRIDVIAVTKRENRWRVSHVQDAL